MTKRRWLISIIATSQKVQPAMPFQRGNRQKPTPLIKMEAALPAVTQTSAAR